MPRTGSICPLFLAALFHYKILLRLAAIKILVILLIAGFVGVIFIQRNPQRKPSQQLFELPPDQLRPIEGFFVSSSDPTACVCLVRDNDDVNQFHSIWEENSSFEQMLFSTFDGEISVDPQTSEITGTATRLAANGDLRHDRIINVKQDSFEMIDDDDEPWIWNRFAHPCSTISGQQENDQILAKRIQNVHVTKQV